MTGHSAQQSVRRATGIDWATPPGNPFARSPRSWWIPALSVQHDEVGSGDLQVRWLLEPNRGSVKVARNLARSVLHDWGMERLLGDVELVVSELVTNALRHAAGIAGQQTGADQTVELSLLRRGGEVVCAVRDASDQFPLARDPGHMAETGRGLHLVSCFSRGWGAEPTTPCGKFVWALF